MPPETATLEQDRYQQEEDRRARLEWTRIANAHDILNAKRELRDAARQLAEKLNEEIARGNEYTAFTIAALLAAAKDIIDFGLGAFLIGLIPIAGQLPGYFLSAFLTYFLWRKGWFLRTRIRVIWWSLGIFFDNLPAFNMLPINTLVVLYAWHIVRKRGDAARKKLNALHELTQEEISRLNNDISLLDNA